VEKGTFFEDSLYLYRIKDYNNLVFNPIASIKYRRRYSVVTLYVTSLEKGIGKTAVCAGLGKHLLNDGKKVGFFKPITAGNKPAEGTDSDAAFMKGLLALKEPVEALCPFFTDESDLANKVKEAFVKVSGGKDVVIVEGVDEQGTESNEIVKTLGARAIIVAGYAEELPGDNLIAAGKSLGDNLLGVIINKVPASQAERVRDEAAGSFSQAGMRLLGVLPEDIALFSFTVGELAENIQGEILNNTEKSAELAENIMLGALCVDPGPVYFGRKPNKVAVLRSDRPDMQMAALETSTRALVISGNTPLIPSVRNQAEDKGVPIILTGEDVTTIVTSIEDTLAKARFNQDSKLPKLTEIMEQHFDFQTVYKALGITSQ